MYRRILILGTIVLLPHMLQAQQPAGVVTTLQGTAELSRPSQPAPTALRFKEDVFVRDVINTKEKSLARVLFGGKSTVTVRELSRLEVREEAIAGGGTRSIHELSSGAILVNVAKSLMRPGDEVQIRTPNAVAAIRGTIVFCECRGSGSNTSCNFATLTGIATITPSGKTSTNLSGNPAGAETVTVTGDSPANSQMSPKTIMAPGQVTQLASSFAAPMALSGQQANASSQIRQAAQLANAVVDVLTGQSTSTVPEVANAAAGVENAPTEGTMQPPPPPILDSPKLLPGGGNSLPATSADGAPPPQLPPPGSGKGIGSYLAFNAGGKELYGLNSNGGSESSSYIGQAKADLVVFGHTLVDPTTAITSSYLGKIGSFYMGLLNLTPDAAERTSLSTWVSNGGRLFIQQDHTSGPWFVPANTILADFGFGPANTSTSDSHYIVSKHPIATTPNALTGLTFSGGANSKFDTVPSDATIFARGGSANGPVTGAVRPVGAGFVATTTDIDMWSSVGGYGPGTNNQKLWQNIWAFIDGSATNTMSAPLFSILNGQTFTGPNSTALVQVSNLSLLSDSLLVSSGPTSVVNLSGPLLKAQTADMRVPFSVVGLRDGGRLVSTSADPLVWLQGGNYALSTVSGNSIFDLQATTTAVDSQTGVEIGTIQSVTHDGAFLHASDGATINTQKVLKLDTTLLAATMPLINLLGSSSAQTSLTTETYAIDLFKSKVVSNGPVIALDKGLINVNNGALINLSSGSQLITVGDLLRMTNGSKINVFNGPLINVSGTGSLLDVGGALVNFGGSGGNTIIVNNHIAPTATLSGLPVSATSGATISMGPSPIKNPSLGSISVTGSLIQAINGGQVMIKGKK